jgi:hypothetical protein
MTLPPIPSEFDPERELVADLFEVADNAALTGLSVEFDERYQAMDAQARKTIDHAIARAEALRDQLIGYGVTPPQAKELVETFMRCPCDQHIEDINRVRNFAMRQRAAYRSMINLDVHNEEVYRQVREAFGFTEEQMAAMGMSLPDVVAMRDARRESDGD